MPTYYRHIIWDWNGTLLDDRALALRVVNEMLQKRGLTPIDMDDYLELFDHPVMDFYAAIGLGPEVMPISQVAHEFQSGYAAGSRSCQLQPGAEQVLSKLQQQGLGQSILSASHQQVLQQSVGQLGVRSYFAALLGLSDHYAHSKIELGRAWLANQPFHPAQALLIGDTTHDFDVAKSLGCDCLLVARGHQCTSKLSECGVPVLADLRELAERCSLTAEALFGLAGNGN